MIHTQGIHQILLLLNWRMSTFGQQLPQEWELGDLLGESKNKELYLILELISFYIQNHLGLISYIMLLMAMILKYMMVLTIFIVVKTLTLFQPSIYKYKDTGCQLLQENIFNKSFLILDFHFAYWTSFKIQMTIG